MSRIGKRILSIPQNVTVTAENNVVVVKGPKGELSFPISRDVVVNVEDNTVKVERANNTDRSNVMQGTLNSLIFNMIEGVTKGYSKGLEIVGVGYRFQLQGNTLVINAGHSHPDKISIPSGIQIEAVSNTEIVVKGINKELVGELSSNIRRIKPPEPYKGKGIKYKDEIIRRKEGKKASK